jgi:hypothetical protein
MSRRKTRVSFFSCARSCPHRWALPDHACENESGTEPKLDPAIRFYQYAGATIAHQQTHEQFAMRGGTGQVNNT